MSNCCGVKSKKTALFGLRDDFSTNSMINALFFSFWEHYVVYTNAAHCMSRYFLHKLNIGQATLGIFWLFFSTIAFSWWRTVIEIQSWFQNCGRTKFDVQSSFLCDQNSKFQRSSFWSLEISIQHYLQICISDNSGMDFKKVPLVYFKNDKSIIFWNST